MAVVDGESRDYAGFICIGDRHGLKQSMPETFLKDAASSSAQFADRCFVQSVILKNGKAAGVVAEITGKDGVKFKLRVLSKIVVLACGSIHTPALLLKSGVKNKNGLIGKGLRLHPVTVLAAVVPNHEPDVAMWKGAPMTCVSNEVAAGRSNDYYGAKLEVPSVHPGLAAFSMPWKGSEDFKRTLLLGRRMFTGIVLTRDGGEGGSVQIDKDGRVRIHYEMCEKDRTSMGLGLEKLVRAFAAAGATRMMVLDKWWDLSPVTSSGPAVADVDHAGGGPSSRRDETLDAISRAIRANGCRHGFRYGHFCAHQMGSCRMGSSYRNSVVRQDGRVWEIANLYVADTSVFPTASGANPMLSVLAVAYCTAQEIKKWLLAENEKEFTRTGVHARL